MDNDEVGYVRLMGALMPGGWTDPDLALVKRRLDTCISTRQYGVLVRRFGLNGGTVWTRPRIALDTPSLAGPGAISDERVRQIEANALRILRREIGRAHREVTHGS